MQPPLCSLARLSRSAFAAPGPQMDPSKVTARTEEEQANDLRCRSTTSAKEEEEEDAIHTSDDRGSRLWNCSLSEVAGEAKKQAWLAVPLIAVNMLQYSLQVISIMFVGHLGELPLSSASMATSFGSVTGLSVMMGLGSTLETLSGQAYGAGQYHMLGVHTQRAMLVVVCLGVPLSVIWFYTGRILMALGQDPQISIGAGHYNRWMIPTLFANGLLQCLNRFFQTQSIVWPMLISSAITMVLHVVACWVLIYKLELGSKGAALASDFLNIFNVILLGLYIYFSPTGARTWAGFTRDALRDLKSFIKLAVPSTIMICLEYWSFEMIVLLSGLLPNPKLETSVLSISLNTCWMVYTISVGLGGAISTRVANELGAGRPRAAQLALEVMIIIALSEGAVVGITTILIRHIWGKLYSNENEVITYVARMMLLLALSDFLDGFQCVLSGSARGCGWQKLCVLINLGAYYIVAIPSAVLLAFVFHVGGMGLWVGIICGLSVQNIALLTVNACTNWEKEARKATARVQNTTSQNTPS